MKQERLSKNIPSRTIQKHIALAFGIRIAVFTALLVSFAAYKMPHYPYYAATLDFQPTEFRESPHNFFSSDRTRWLEGLGASVERALHSDFTSLPINHLPTTISVLFFFTLGVVWVLTYIVLGARQLKLYRQHLIATILFVCAISPGAAFGIAGLISSPSIEEFYAKQYILLTEKASPIINALDAFHTDHGVYPDTLEQLLPQYLSEIPIAGIRVCPEFNYFGPGSKLKQPYRKALNPPLDSERLRVTSYELNVGLHKVRSHHASDMFYYLYFRPEQNYPDSHVQINQWAIASSGWVRVP